MKNLFGEEVNDAVVAVLDAAATKVLNRKNDPKRTFDAEEGLKARDRGVERASTKRAVVLSEARQLAVKIAEAAPNRECHSDLVMAALLESGFTPGDLGPAAGSVFRGSRWEFTGKWMNSTRVSNHAASIRIWRLL